MTATELDRLAPTTTVYIVPDPSVCPAGAPVLGYDELDRLAELRATEVAVVTEERRALPTDMLDALTSLAVHVEHVRPSVGRTLADHLGAGLNLDDLTPATAAAVSIDTAPAASVVRLSEVRPEKVRWLWSGRIPLGKLTVLDGRPKVGKSTLALDLAARVTTGRPMPDGDELDGPASVVLLSAEDGLADTIAPRLAAAGADLARVVAIDRIAERDDTGEVIGYRSPALPTDLDELEAVVRVEGAVLVIIDVLMAYLAAGVKSYSDQDIRRALMPLAKMAERTGAAVLVLRHPRKGGGSALDAGGGSVGIVGAARSVLLAAIDPDDETETRRVLALTACNLAPPSPTLGYVLASDEATDVARVEWTGITNHRADDLSMQLEPTEDRTARSEAETFLAELLADGPVAAPEAKAAGRRAGIAERTLDRARRKLGVTSRREGFGAGATYWWEHPPPATTAPMLAMDATSPMHGEAGEHGEHGGREVAP